MPDDTGEVICLCDEFFRSHASPAVHAELAAAPGPRHQWTQRPSSTRSST